MSISCTNKKPDITDSVGNRAETARLKALDITTIISDSGITRYRITADEWLVFDKATEPHWLFPQGLHFERFDQNYNVDAQIDCKHATYYDKRSIRLVSRSKCSLTANPAESPPRKEKHYIQFVSLYFTSYFSMKQ